MDAALDYGRGEQLLSDAAEAALVESLASVVQFLDGADDEDLIRIAPSNGWSGFPTC